MAETGKHVNVMIYGINALETHYADRRDSVLVAANNFLYYEEGNPSARISPDIYVVFGVSMWPRDSYKVWEEGGKMPSVVLEITSKKTRGEDNNRKFDLYEQVLKVPEYFQFDPTRDYIGSRIRGYRLQNGAYVPIPLVEGRVHSEQLGLDLVADGEMLRFFDPGTQRFLPSSLEQANLANAEARRANEEAQRADDEAQRATEEAQRADEESLRADMAVRQAEAEVQRADEALRQAEAEARARRDAEEKLARLEAELAVLRRAAEGG